MKEIMISSLDKLKMRRQIIWETWIIGAAGGAEASRTRVRCAREASLKVKESIQGRYPECLGICKWSKSSCGHEGDNDIIYSPTRDNEIMMSISRVSWDMKVKLGLWQWRIWPDRRMERMMVRWMCGVHLKNRRLVLNSTVGLALNALQRLWWFSHVERKDSDDLVSACRGFEAEGVRYRGRGKNTL